MSLRAEATLESNVSPSPQVAIARKNASIDVVLPSNSRIDSAACEEQLHATCLATIRNTKMKAGIHRWIGLAVCSTGIYAATSAGDFIFTELQPKNTGADQPSSSTPSNLGLARQLSMSPPQRLQLPEPLQSLVFHPPSNPTHFLCGGEEVPLSIWNIRTALSPRVSTAEQQKESGQYVSPGGELAAESWEAANEGNAKLRKRRRQAEARAKAKELLWGEVWRAKAVSAHVSSRPISPFTPNSHGASCCVPLRCSCPMMPYRCHSDPTLPLLQSSRLATLPTRLH